MDKRSTYEQMFLLHGGFKGFVTKGFVRVLRAL